MGAYTPLEFHNEAISLSGITGTKLKCEVIGKYYPFWWKITSGGKKHNYRTETAIIELYAATAEDYIKETGETILGSSGHALDLKVNHFGDSSLKTDNLKIVLVEEDTDCYKLLKKVIGRRWPDVSIDEAEGPINSNHSNIYLLNKGLEDAIATIDRIGPGIAIFYFDPLRNIKWKAIEEVAEKRITMYNLVGTEFLIFLFTSDWFLGRDELTPLPETDDQLKWSKAQESTVFKADALFGTEKWRKFILKSESIENREKSFLTFYKFRLHKWFRYVLALPFAPKEKQLFNLILCSNYEAGIKVFKDFYDTMTGNPTFLPRKSPFSNSILMLPEIAPRDYAQIRSKYETFRMANPLENYKISRGGNM